MAARMVTTSGVFMMINGQHIICNKNQPHYEELVAAITAGKSDEELLFIIHKEENRLSQEISKLGDSNLAVEGNVIYFQGTPLEGSVVESFQEAVLHGYPLHPLQNYLYNVAKNPDENIRKALFDLLYEAKCPLTEDGNFLAYLPIRGNYTDLRTGKLDHAIGQTISTVRALVNKDLSKAVTIAASFNGLNRLADSNNRVMVACIAPQDVVVIRDRNIHPQDETVLLAACRYEITAEYVGYRPSQGSDVLGQSSVIALEHDEVFTVQGFNPLSKEWVRVGGANSLPLANNVAEEELSRPTYISVRIYNNQGDRPYTVIDNRNYKEASLNEEQSLAIYNKDGDMLMDGFSNVSSALGDMADLADVHGAVYLKDKQGNILQTLE